MRARPAHCHRRGFTLIEMIITLCVFILLAAAVFGIFDATLQGVASLETDQKREDRADAFAGWLKHQLETLPADGIIASYHRANMPLHASGIAWGKGCDLQALDLCRQPNGLYELRLTRFQPAPDGDADTQAALTTFTQQLFNENSQIAWRPLLRDLAEATWRFRPGTGPRWEDVTSGDRQTAVEFTFRPAGSSAAVTIDNWIPSVSRASTPVLVSANKLEALP